MRLLSNSGVSRPSLRSSLQQFRKHWYRRRSGVGGDSDAGEEWEICFSPRKIYPGKGQYRCGGEYATSILAHASLDWKLLLWDMGWRIGPEIIPPAQGISIRAELNAWNAGNACLRRHNLQLGADLSLVRFPFVVGRQVLSSQHTGVTWRQHLYAQGDLADSDFIC